MILVIDNYDSFVFNIARALEELGAPCRVVRNDSLTVDQVAALGPAAIVLSPGPGRPDQAGVGLDLIRRFSGRLPLFGICLGHQCIGQAFGGRIVRAQRPLHGRSSPVHHDGTGLFSGLPDPLEVGRYHALAVTLDDGQTTLRVTARSDEGEIMAVAHQTHPTFGVQFHPESVLTPHGQALFANFLKVVR